MPVSKDNLERVNNKDYVKDNKNIQYYTVKKGTITPFPTITEYGIEGYDNDITTFFKADEQMYSITNNYVNDDTMTVLVSKFDDNSKTHTLVGALWKQKILANKGGKRKTVRRIKKRSKNATASKNYLRF